MLKRLTVLVAAMMTAGALAAAPSASAVTIRNNFPRPPQAAVKALNRTVGKPFKAGYVFIDGKYVPPPYTVERYGTVVRINGFQVTSEIVPWEEFIKTQAGVTVTKTEKTETEGGLSDDLFDDAPAAEPTVEEEEEEEEEDSASSLDDLFEDDPQPKKATRKTAKKTTKKKSYRPKPKKPTTVVSYSFEGTFTPNARTKEMLAKINAQRTWIDSQLRSGANFFFSARYSNVSGDVGTSKRIMERLPDIMKNSSSRESFGAACRQAGLAYLPPALLDDLHRNRFDYIQLLERRKADRAETQWQSLFME
ncbi:MAG: hypothetical protein ACI4R9_02415 [Kiritimatiellia bacterium]